jgi:hypothetical protein
VRAPDLEALRARWQREQASGFALFDGRVALAASAAAARAQRAPDGRFRRRRYGAVRILADEGDVIKVTTDLGRDEPFEPLDRGAFVVEGWLGKQDTSRR